MRLSGELVRNLHPSELKILHVIERLMTRFDWVPLEFITKSAGYSQAETGYRLSQIIKKGLCKYEAVPYEGYALVFLGYDTIALRSLAAKETVSALGPFIGEGKESVVYEALGLTPLAIKFHRVGQRAFRHVRLNREYLSKEGHCPWLLASRFSAEREFAALKQLVSRVRVPVPVGVNRHAVVMSHIGGEPLHRCRLLDPEPVLSSILDEARECYRCGIIHGDLSEYNVMVDRDQVYLIDWPSWVETDHPNASAILEHDIRTVLGYFRKKYRVDVPVTEALDRVLG